MRKIQLVYTCGSFRLTGIVTHHKMHKVIRGRCEHDALQQCCRLAHWDARNLVMMFLLISNTSLSEISGKIPSNITWGQNLDLSQAAGNNEQCKGKFRCCKSLDFRVVSYCSYIFASKESVPPNPLGRGLVLTFCLLFPSCWDVYGFALQISHSPPSFLHFAKDSSPLLLVYQPPAIICV